MHVNAIFHHQVVPSPIDPKLQVTKTTIEQRPDKPELGTNETSQIIRNGDTICVMC